MRRRQQSVARCAPPYKEFPLPPPRRSLPNVASRMDKTAQHATGVHVGDHALGLSAPHPLQSGGLATTGGGGGGRAPTGTGNDSQFRHLPSRCVAGASTSTAAAACSLDPTLRAPCALARSCGVCECLYVHSTPFGQGCCAEMNRQAPILRGALLVLPEEDVFPEGAGELSL